jgi:hypothetical protein
LRFYIFEFNIVVMKRKLLYGAFSLFAAWAFNSCEGLTDCGLCRYVTYENGAIINEGPETEYCGDDLIKMKATSPVTIGTLTTKVKCR